MKDHTRLQLETKSCAQFLRSLLRYCKGCANIPKLSQPRMTKLLDGKRKEYHALYTNILKEQENSCEITVPSEPCLPPWACKIF